jgi:hypothetical protein
MFSLQRPAAPIVITLLALGCGKTDDENKGVSLTSCEKEFSACGGDPIGSWSLEETCVDGSLTDAVDAYFSDYASCKNSVREARLTTSAGVTYAASTFDREGSSTMDAKLEITEDCFREQSGNVLNALTCMAYGQVMEGQSGMMGNCSYDGSVCNCDITFTQSLDGSGEYSVNGSKLVEADGRSLEFCASEGRLAYRSILVATANGKVQVSGVAVLKKNE